MICVDFAENTFVHQFRRHLLILSFLTFVQLASNSMTSYINRMLCVMCYIRYVCIITPRCMRIKARLQKIIYTGHRRRLPRSAHWQALDGDSGFFS